jgi:RecB family exonuclease
MTSRKPGPSARPSAPASTQLALEGMPRRLFRCTPSRLLTYADCPRRYRFTYLDRPAPPRGPAWAHNSLGASVHNALRNWWDSEPPMRTPARAAHLLRRGWLGEGWRDAEQSHAWRERAAAMVERYTAELDPAAEPRGLERTVAARTERLALSGRVDRLDEVDGELVVVDYKTSRRPPEDADARASLALAVYAVAAASTLRRPCRRVELHHLPSGATAVAQHDDASLARHIRRAESLADDIERATGRLDGGADPDEAFAPTPGPLCSWCDYRGACPVGQAAAPTRVPWHALEPGDG